MQINKKLKKVLIIFMLILTKNINSQSSGNSIGLQIGYAEKGFGINANYNYHLSRNDFIQASIYYSSSNIKKNNFKIPFDIFTLNLGYLYTLYSNRRNTISSNIGGGALIGYEIVNKGENELNTGALLTDKSKFLYGGYITTEFDYLLSNDFSLLLKSNLFYHPSSDLGITTFFIGAGIKYIIY